jgi:hypothetical protein
MLPLGSRFTTSCLSERARASAQYGTWNRMSPYGNCLSMADACYRELRRRLRNDPQLARYADDVELATCNWRRKATSDTRWHTIYMTRFLTHCLVLDPVYHHLDVQLIQVNTVGGAGVHHPDHWPLYCYVSGPGATSTARILVQYHPTHMTTRTYREPPTSAMIPPFLYTDPYTNIRGGLVGGVLNLAYLASKNRYESANGSFPSYDQRSKYLAEPSYPLPDLPTIKPLTSA